MGRIDLSGRLIVVSGASSGLGREIARVLAYRQKADLVVTARRKDRLEELQREIQSRSASRVHVVPLDMADPGAPGALFREATARGEVFALVSSAGFTFYGKTLEGAKDLYETMMRVNFISPAQCILLFLDAFLRRRSGGVLVVTSLSAFMPLPYQNVYAASKHALQAFVEGLAAEYRGAGVVFSTFAPGGMATEMLTLSGISRRVPLESPVNMDPARAARLAVAGFTRGRLLTVPGALYRAMSLLVRLVPRSAVAAAASRIYRT
jgi:short-subunit dehydrogenase